MLIGLRVVVGLWGLGEDGSELVGVIVSIHSRFLRLQRDGAGAGVEN